MSDGLFTDYPDSPYKVPTATHSDPQRSRFDLEAMPTDAAKATLDKDASKDETDELADELTDLQERLYADRSRSVLVVLQAIDAGGKDSTIRRVFGHLNPQGVRVWSFKVPSELERDHDFMWRYHQKTPARGMIGIFNRSHYESVLVERIKGIVSRPKWSARYEQINTFEKGLVAEGTIVLKFFLNLSPSEQADRFRDRLTEKDKWWKFSESDLIERRRWYEYRAAFRDALAACSTPWAPWYCIPADQKWHRDHAISGIVAGAMRALDLSFPEPAEDMAERVDEFLKALDEPLEKPE